jgi:hypothetical protein
MEDVNKFLDVEQGTIYKIRNKKFEKNGFCLNSLGTRLGQGSVSVQRDDNVNDHSHQLWTLQKTFKNDEYFKIKNLHSSNFLNSWDNSIGKNSTSMQKYVPDIHEHINHRIWHVEKDGEYYKIKNLHSGNYLSMEFDENLCSSDVGGLAIMEKEIKKENENFELQLWSFVPIYKKVIN